MAAAEDAQAIEFGPVIPVVPNRAAGWIGTSAGQVLFALNGTLAAG